MAHRQLLFNFLGYVVFVAVMYSTITAHACPLKSSSLEAGLEIFTKLIIPLSLFSAKSVKGIFGRAILCGLIAFAVNTAYDSWLHSDSFPRDWLDARAKEWLLKVDEQKAEAYRQAGQELPSSQ